MHDTEVTSPLVAVKGPSVVKSVTFGKHRPPLPPSGPFAPTSPPSSEAPDEPPEEPEDCPPEEPDAPPDEPDPDPDPDPPLLPEPPLVDPDPDPEPLEPAMKGSAELLEPPQCAARRRPKRLTKRDAIFMKMYL